MSERAIEFWKGQLFELLTPNMKVFFTQLLEYESILLIQRPVSRKNIPMTIENGMSLTIYFHDDVKGLCTFDSKIYQLENKQIYMKKPLMNSIKKAQRRNFFRVQVAVEVELRFASENISNEVEHLTTFTHDISGGGISFLSTYKVTEEDRFTKGILHLKTNNGSEKIHFNGKIVNVMKQNQIYRISLQFVEMSEETRKKIIQFCMFKQIELRNKVMGQL